jgi:hypothetical protein
MMDRYFSRLDTNLSSRRSSGYRDMLCFRYDSAKSLNAREKIAVLSFDSMVILYLIVERVAGTDKDNS